MNFPDCIWRQECVYYIVETERKDRKAEDPFWEDENPESAQFPYVNGGLFADEDIIIPPFTEKLKDIILNKASRGFESVQGTGAHAESLRD